MARRLTYDEVKHFIEVKSDSDCKLLSKEYKNNLTKMLFQCKCGNKFETTLKGFQKGKRHCDKCGLNSFRNKKMYTYDEIKNYIYEKSKGKCHLVSNTYKGCYEKIILKCECGNNYTSTFAQVKAINQFQCPKCSYKESSKKQSHSYKYVKDFIENKSNSGCKLLTSTYINAKQILDIRCKCGEIFQISFDSFVRAKKRQCNMCGYAITGEKLANPYEQIKKDIESKNNCKLVTKKDDYINTRTPIIIKCKCGNQYSTTYFSFINSKGQCQKCAYEDIGLQNTKTHEDFIKEVYNLVGDEYTILDKYTNAKIKIKIKHNKCGYIYKVTPDSFLQGTRCLKCASSKGEITISEYLRNKNIRFMFEYKFDDCKNKRPLPFDFYLPDYNICIEYDGGQHYRPIDYFGGKKRFKYIQQNDNIKNQYCKGNNIPLLRIPYWEFDNIEEILDKWLSKYELIHNENIKNVV